jgi:[ribosomal protein S5]-alanine N-acetyltransferase
VYFTCTPREIPFDSLRSLRARSSLRLKSGFAQDDARCIDVAATNRMDYFLKTSRLGFRCWQENDLPLATALWGDPEVTALIGGPFTAEQIRSRLETEISRMKDYGVQYWPIFFLADHQHAGCAGLRPYRIEDGVYEIGVHIRRSFWRQGLAEEVMRAVIDYAFDTLGANALFAGHNPANEASRNLLAKLGFVYTHDELYAPTGLMHLSYLLRKP